MPGLLSPTWDVGTVQLTRFADHLRSAMVRQEIPSRHVTLLLNFGDPLILTGNDGGRRKVGSFVTGLQTGPAIIERGGQQAGVHLRMPPTTAYALFGVPMHLLTGEVVDAAAVLGPRAARLAEGLTGASSVAQARAVLHAEFRSGWAAARQPSATVVRAWNGLIATRGAMRVDELVRLSGWSHRHLDARFREEIGVLPKTAARLLRFEYAAALLRAARMPLAALAAEAGYYDQAHLNRDFRSLAGCSPGAFRYTAS
jgi:AraC-like DNA-binding protein